MYLFLHIEKETLKRMTIHRIKRYLKQNIPCIRKLAYIKNKYKSNKTIINNINDYEKTYLKYSTDLPGADDARSQRRLIIIGSHIIEKGLSHSDYKPGFGKQIIIDLQDNIVRYRNSNSPDVFAISNAISLLYKYHEMNMDKGFDDSQYLDITKFLNFDVEDLGPYEISNDNLCDPVYFKTIAEKRHSVRCYEEDGLQVSDEILKKIVYLANTAPSACNRQATHVFAISNRELFQEIEDLHGGCKGFGRHVSLFLFITSDLSLYSSNEIKLPIFDAGIFTMNLLYALQSYGLYSCTLNASFPGKASYKIHEITSIPKKFDINGLIAVYNLKPNTVSKIAASPRRKANDVLTFINS